MEQVSVLSPVEKAGLDPERLEGLFARVGTRAGENMVCRAMEELAYRLGRADSHHESGEYAEMRKCTRALGAIAEQIRRLRAEGIDYRIIPGVPAYAAAAAALGQELTVPEVAQSIVLTRVSMKSTSMPARETLENFALSGATLAIHLGVRAMREIERALIPHYGADCPVVVACRVGWPDELFIRGTLADIREKVRAEKITRTALILVGPVLGDIADFRESALYDPAHPHVLRPKATARR